MRKNMKKLTVATVIGAMTVTALAPVSAQAKDKTLTVAIWDNGQKAGLQEIMDEFTKETGIKTELQVVEWSSYWTLLEAGASGGDMPDVFWMHSNEAVRYMSNDILLDLTDKIADYLPFLQRTNKKDITIQELLYHQSGLPPGIAFYREAIDEDSYEGRLFMSRKDARHPLQLGTSTWANPNFAFKKEYVSKVKTGDYTLQICDSLWLNPSFFKEMEKKIVDAPMKPKTYRYSDVGFILLRLLVEKLAGMPMDAYLQREFYEPMGLERTGYLPLRRFPKSEIVPSSVDRFLRKTTLQGFVHDEAAAFQGGVSGNAGLFSNAREVAQVYQMLLNGGELNGQRYLSKETCQLFTAEVSKISRRGLGFDKPDTRNQEKSPCGTHAPAKVYGHTGFTGTCAWVDPDNRLVYVFLSNRIYPDVTNRKLSRLEIREQIQDAIYDAIQNK